VRVLDPKGELAPILGLPAKISPQKYEIATGVSLGDRLRVELDLLLGQVRQRRVLVGFGSGTPSDCGPAAFMCGI
jgi:hypothetical protein